MYIIEEITKAPIYIKAEVYNYINNSFFNDKSNETCYNGYPKRSRGVYPQGVYKNTKCYRVTLTKEYLAHLKEVRIEKIKDLDLHCSYIWLSTVINDIFKNRRMYRDCVANPNNFPVTDTSQDTLYASNKSKYEGYNKETYTFEIYAMDDWVKCPTTKKEEEIIEAENTRKATETVNVTFLKDTIINTLSAAGIDVKFIAATGKERAQIKAADRRTWNNLITVAISHYINDIVKEQGFTVDPVKAKANAKLSEDLPLFFLDSIKPINNQ